MWGGGQGGNMQFFNDFQRNILTKFTFSPVGDGIHVLLQKCHLVVYLPTLITGILSMVMYMSIQ